MINLPADMLALSLQIPPPKEWIVAKLIMPLGDVWISDRPVSTWLLALLPSAPLPVVEDWGTLEDGGGVEKIMAAGTTGYLCCPKTRIVLIRADQTKSDIDSIISQGIHNRRIELYRWFEGMTSGPFLIDILFCQDRVELSESSMLFSFDAVGALASENPYMTDRANGNKNWPYLIGKAEGVKLELMEDQSSNFSVLLGDKDGNEIDEEYIGLIRVDDATNLSAGDHLINGEQVSLAVASAGYMTMTARARSGTETQDHGNGSRIFPLGAVYKYAVCAGAIGSLDLLRTSNEIDIYDEDGDLDTEEYRDLYSGGNEELHPELNPAQIWFNDRMPWLKKDQDYDIDDRVFYGKQFSFVDAISVRSPSGINKDGGKAEVLIPFREFSKDTGNPADYWFIGTTLPLPAIPGEGSGASTYAASENMTDGSGYFEVNQSFGDYLSGSGLTSTAYREFKVNSSCPPGEEAWTMAAPIMPDTNSFVFTPGDHKWAMVIQRLTTSWMDVKIEINEVWDTGSEFPIWSYTALGSMLGEHNWLVDFGVVRDFLIGSNFQKFLNNERRMMMKVTCLTNSSAGSYAYVRVGSKIANGDGQFHYGLGAIWNYIDSAPTAHLISKFSRNLSSRGVFISAKARIKGVLRNTENKADGTLKIYDGAVEKHSGSIADGDAVDVEVDLDAETWNELYSSEIKIEVSLDYALLYDFTEWTVTGIPRTDGKAGIELDGGVEWLISYTANNIDGVQINYTDQLYVDAVSSRGADWTPAQALQYLSEDKTSWASDMLDTTDLSTRHAEFVAAGHYLNGLLTTDRYQSAVKEIMRQGFSMPVQSGGKISLQSYLSWPAPVVLSGDNDSLYSKGKTFSMTDTVSLIQRLVIDYKKNFSTGVYDGQHELSTGNHVENMTAIALDLVNSDTAVQQAAAWLFALKSVQLESFGFDGNFRLLQAQLWDKVNLPNFLAGNLQEDMIVFSVDFQFAQPKNDKPSKLIINTVKV